MLSDAYNLPKLHLTSSHLHHYRFHSRYHWMLCSMKENLSMQRRARAFTLIELLVVIAIIAILAAILFPVFAQAREKARGISCLSNTKQLGTSIMMYVQDYDEMYPMGFQGDSLTWTTNASWPQIVQPYVKSLAVFVCPDDKGGPYPGGNATSWLGWGISYASNGLYDENFCCGPNWNSGFFLDGPMGMSGEGPTGWLDGGALNLAAVTQPAATILLTEKHNNQTTFVLSTGLTGNPSGFAPNCVISGPVLDGTGWGDNLEPDGTPGAVGATPSRIGKAYPNGPNGAVSATHTNMANFAFCDGHSKAMLPVQTNPDSVNQPQNNMWNGLR
jgi:prepilin-type N-terminal cleavage/methylation domain-containing protein/prepilin-type processing-associated H-X9-DG protein